MEDELKSMRIVVFCTLLGLILIIIGITLGLIAIVKDDDVTKNENVCIERC